jgi:hypothetical protein
LLWPQHHRALDGSADRRASGRTAGCILGRCNTLSSNLPLLERLTRDPNVDDFVDTGVDAVNPWDAATR